jgi:hypothetical protein
MTVPPTRAVTRIVVALACVLAVTVAVVAGGHLRKAAATPLVPAYWLVASDGGVFSFGGAPFYGSMGGHPLNQPIVGMAATPDEGGYWEVAADGGIFSFGDAQFYGSMGGHPLNKPVVGMAATADGGGYWEVASDGGIFSFGDAQFYGSMGGHPLNKPVVGMAAVPGGGGYWEVASDGGIFSFGDAQFYGSMGGHPLNQPIVGMAATPDGGGYWEVAADGGIFSFGNAQFYGSLGGIPQRYPVVAMATASTGGYWFANANGGVTALGDATYWGSAPQVLNAPVVGMAAGRGTGVFAASAFPSGSYGYDVSNWQCVGGLPPDPHTIGVVEVNGASFGGANPCLATEAAWAGAGLNLYTFLTYGTQGTSGDPSCAVLAVPSACNYGFAAAQDAFSEAAAAGADTAVPWWLDVEAPSLWSTNLAANASLVQGAIEGLHAEGLNSVGVYASPGVWNSIVGDYQPAVPYWMASWQYPGGPASLCSQGTSAYPNDQLPTGPVQLVQYGSPQYPVPEPNMDTAFDNDYAC